MGYEYFVARRYLTARRKQAFISVITFVSVLGVTIGVMALVIAIALITGFQGDVQDKILGATSHVMVSDITGQGLSEYQQIADKVTEVKGVVSVSPVAYDLVLLSGPYKSYGAMLKGMDLEREKVHSPWLDPLERGNLPDENTRREGILLGKRLAMEIGANIGDVITVLTSTARLSPIGLIPKTKKLVVTGIFNTGLYEFDSGTALVHLRTAQSLFGLEDKINYLQVNIDDIFQAPEYAEKIKSVIPPEAFVTTWMELNRSLFSALDLEKRIIFLTIALIVIVAALNIIASLILMVMEKTRDIGILMTMGATSRNIRTVFFLQGAMIGFIGTALGAALGLIWCWLANAFKLIKVPVDIYQISHVPFHIRFADLCLIIFVTLVICNLATLFPSHRASKVDPVSALKYE